MACSTLAVANKSPTISPKNDIHAKPRIIEPPQTPMTLTALSKRGMSFWPMASAPRTPRVDPATTRKDDRHYCESTNDCKRYRCPRLLYLICHDRRSLETAPGPEKDRRAT